MRHAYHLPFRVTEMCLHFEEADLTSRGQPPMLGEESGEAGPLAQARASGRSQNPISAEEVNRHGVALGLL